MSSSFSVVAIISAFNEADVIGQVVGDLINQGVLVYFIDDGSTDGTLDEVHPYFGRGVIQVERMTVADAARPRQGFEWERILIRKAEIAQEIEADWFIHSDADEFREGPWPGMSLQESIRRVNDLGFNAIDFACLDFWPTHDRFHPGDDLRAAFESYAVPEPYDRVQIRCWKKTQHIVDLASTGGHEVLFSDRNVFPWRFILRHYPIRSQAHGDRKVFVERLTRFANRERAMGWHVQYDSLRPGDSFLRDPKSLRRYDADAVRLELALRHRGVEGLEAALGSARHEIEVLRSDQAAQIETRRDREPALADAVARVETQAIELMSLRREAEERSSNLAMARNSLAVAEDRIEALRADCAARVQELRAREDDLTGAVARIELQREEMAALRESFDQRLSELALTRADLRKAGDLIDGLGSMLEHKTSEMDVLRAEFEAQRTAVDTLQADHNELRKADQAIQRRLDDVLRSLSWRWTGPVRTLVRLIRGR